MIVLVPIPEKILDHGTGMLPIKRSNLLNSPHHNFTTNISCPLLWDWYWNCQHYQSCVHIIYVALKLLFLYTFVVALKRKQRPSPALIQTEQQRSSLFQEQQAFSL